MSKYLKYKVCLYNFLIVGIIIFLFTGCNSQEPNPYNEQKHDLAAMKEFRQRIEETRGMEQEFNFPDGITLEILKADLLERGKLIPFDGVFGGTPFYYEGSIYFFDEYVFVMAEDGHIMADMVLRYNITKGNNIQWELVAYDRGIWEHEDLTE